ncbi:MAG: hypothetical protein MUC62_07565 [Candidatus Thermoplasmatota archaeon]|jgi:hypothetical protein|nr:hypothetical protein [Candidatus Thermoplasmatota archaeon]
MASLDKDKKKRLKEASSLYEKSLKAFQKGDITKEELKERLRPYKYELRELGYPVKIKDDEGQPSTGVNGPVAAPIAASDKEDDARRTAAASYTLNITPWSRRSQLTMDEVEKRVDTISLTKQPSEKLQSMYQDRYGEDLRPPLDLVPYTASSNGPPQAPKGPGQVQLAPSDAQADEDSPRKPFWKGLFKGRRRA